MCASFIFSVVSLGCSLVFLWLSMIFLIFPWLHVFSLVFVGFPGLSCFSLVFLWFSLVSLVFIGFTRFHSFSLPQGSPPGGVGAAGQGRMPSRLMPKLTFGRQD